MFKISPWYYVALGIAVLSVLGIITHSIYMKGYDAADSEWKGKIQAAENRAAELTKQLQSTATVREKELRTENERIKTLNDNLQKELSHEIFNNPTYLDSSCNLTDNAFRLLNSKRQLANPRTPE